MAWWTKQKPKRVIGDPVIGKHFFAEDSVLEKYAGQYEIYKVSPFVDGVPVYDFIYNAWNRSAAVQIISLLDSAVDREQEKKQNIS